LFASALPAGAADPPLKFAFGAGLTGDGTRVQEEPYTDAHGWGFEPDTNIPAPGVASMPATAPALRASGPAVTSDKQFLFSVKLPEGNWRVTLTLGGPFEATTTIKAEARRLLVENLHTAPGQTVKKTFTVNIRTPKLPDGAGGDTVKLDPREPGSFTWDDKLSLLFTGQSPAVAALEIERADNVPTVFLCGDSTVTDQPREPYGTWGMMLPRFFGPGVAVANHAESGQTLKAFRMEHRWDKVMSGLKAGDYVFMQFGHNDLNKSGRNTLWPPGDPSGDWSKTYSEAGTDYKKHLKEYAAEVKAKGATPVIVSPMTKIDIRSGALNPSMKAYADAAVEAAREAGVACIDLNAMSVDLVTALGPERARRAYVDGLHTNSYGGYLLARCIVEGIRRNKLDLAANLAEDAGSFDVAHPEPLPEAFALPLEPAPRPMFGRGRGGAATAPATRPN
jgi:lysophospholipase L1-like esterase